MPKKMAAFDSSRDRIDTPPNLVLLAKTEVHELGVCEARERISSHGIIAGLVDTNPEMEF